MYKIRSDPILASRYFTVKITMKICSFDFHRDKQN